jgi:type I restriction enzyme S subunit
MIKAWQTLKLRDVCELINGRAYSRTELLPEGKYPVLRVGNFFTNNHWYYSDMELESNKYCDDGDLLYAWSASFGPRIWTGGKVIFHYHIWKVIPNATLIDQRFLFHFLGWDTELIKEDQGTGTTMIHVAKGSMEDRSVPIPSLSEQQRIIGILDEAFDGIATAKANAEKNLQNARALFESHLQSVFTHRGKGWVVKTLGEMCERITKGSSPKWQGMAYVDNPGILFVTSENVGEYKMLLDRPKYVEEKFNVKDKKSILEVGDVLTNIVGASIGRTAVFDRNEVANINQAVCLIRCKADLLNNFFLTYLLNSPFFKQVLHDNEVNNARANLSLGFFSQLLVPTPPLSEQRKIVFALDTLREQTQRLESIYQQKLTALDELKKSLLQQAFTGQLTQQPMELIIIPFPTRIPNVTTTDLHAGILAMAYRSHEENGKLGYFTHVKAEKIAHMVEARLGIDLGRNPVKDAAGPNDFNHLNKVEHRARMANYFNFKRINGAAYRVQKLGSFERLIDKTRAVLGDRREEVEHLLKWMLPMNWRQAEIVATVYAAWNNLLMDGKKPSDEQIVFESRENWHPDKLEIDREKFFSAVKWLKKQRVVPEGKGRRVADKGK